MCARDGEHGLKEKEPSERGRETETRERERERFFGRAKKQVAREYGVNRKPSDRQQQTQTRRWREECAHSRNVDATERCIVCPLSISRGDRRAAAASPCRTPFLPGHECVGRGSGS